MGTLQGSAFCSMHNSGKLISRKELPYQKIGKIMRKFEVSATTDHKLKNLFHPLEFEISNTTAASVLVPIQVSPVGNANMKQDNNQLLY